MRGQLELKVSCGSRSTDGSLTVLGCSGPNLCGHDLIQAFPMLKAPVRNESTTGEQMSFVLVDEVKVERLLAEFADVCTRLGPHQRAAGTLSDVGQRGTEIPGKHEVLCAFRLKVDMEIDCLLAAVIIVPVPHSK